MSTSESSKSGANPSDAADPVGSIAAAAAGLPDPAVLEKLANEYFRAVPGQDISSGAAYRSAGPVTDIQSLTLPSRLSIPTESQLQPIGSASPAALAIPPAPRIPLTPGIPGGFSSIDPSASTDFSFLRESRAIFATAPSIPVQAMPASIPAAPVPTPANFQMTDLSTPTISRGFESPMAGISSPQAAIPYADVTAPQIPGAIAPVPGIDRLASFGFLADANPLEPISVNPRVLPVDSDLSKSAPAAANLSSLPFDVQRIRRDFPILQEQINGRPLIWLDNAATTQKPQSVIDRLSYFYAHENSNIHRAAHTLAARATDAYEAAREKVRRFINASSPREIVFVRGATEAINLVAQSWGRRNIQKDDEIVITLLEHHANIVPWQMLCAEKGARLRVAPVDDTGQVILEEYEKLLNSRTKLVSIAHVSNALGTITPVQPMVQMAHRYGARVLIDGAQAVSHMQVDVQQYDCDFYVFSGHKIFAPTGIGVVFGKLDVLENTPPWQGGGNMIADVTFDKTLYQPAPGRFEAGTGNIADAVGLGAAIDYVQRIGMHNIARYEHDLLVYATEALQRIPGLHLIGTAREKASVLSFVLDGFRTEDIGAALNKEGIAVRSGHHCAQPILRRFGHESTVRPSLAFYNTCEEADALVKAIWNLKSARNPGLT